MTALPRALAAAMLLAFTSAGALSAQERTQPPARDAQKRETSEAAEHSLPAAQVPAAVREAFRRAYPSARVLKYASELENGRTTYEIESRDGATRRDLILAADGTILETETQVTPAQLPAAVRSAAEANGARINVAELVVVGRDTTYAITIRGRRGGLKLTKDGRPVPAARP